MRITSLGSGSRGNCLLVESGDTLVMVDCGFSAAEAQRRLQRAGRQPEDLHAILVTHEHGDHASGVMRLARRHGVPVHLTPGTLAAMGEEAADGIHAIDCHHEFHLGSLKVHPLAVPHDAREPCQFVFEAGPRRVGVLTDTGHLTPYLRAALRACDALVLECNHDTESLFNGPYPPSLKARVGGPLGHLSNAQAADLVGGLERSRLQWLVGVHLSERNNTPELARVALSEALAKDERRVVLADQERGFDWLEIV